ncbi:hypothetical protein ABTL66_19480, partial [Acinetobacter baumannii]
EGEKGRTVEAKSAPAPVLTPTEPVLPETPTRIVSDVNQTKRLSITSSDGKASIRHIDGTTKEEPVAQAKPALPQTSDEVTRTGAVL